MIRVGGVWLVTSGEPLCPDRLRFAMLGEADNARGRFIRGLFWLLDHVWPVRP